MSRRDNPHGDVLELRGEVQSVTTPTPELFQRVALTCLAHRPAPVPDTLMSAIDKAAWLDAAHALLEAAYPNTGFMAGRLPTGSAHCRLMVESGNRRPEPVDSFRKDGVVALALLEAILSASSERYHLEL